MSKGSTIVNLRMPVAAFDAMCEEVERFNNNPLNSRLTYSEWIRAAIADKIAHAKRSRQKRKRSKA